MIKEDLIGIILSNPKHLTLEKTFSKNFPKEYKEILSWKFPDTFSFSQKLYHFTHNDKNLQIGVCPVCGNRCSYKRFSTGYFTYCSNSCRMKSKETQNYYKSIYNQKYNCDFYFQSLEFKEYLKKINISKYGVESYLQTKQCRDALKRHNLETLGVEYPFQNTDIFNSALNTLLEKYGNYYFKSNEFLTKIRRLYGDEITTNISQSKIIQDKIRETIISKNPTDSPDEAIYKYYKSLNEKAFTSICRNKVGLRSKLEIDIEDYFLKNNIKFVSQYSKDTRYPFHCDFYLSDFDLFIEIQGTWIHGKHPFDPNNSDDLSIVNIWENKNTPYYSSAIKTWTVKDVLKREIAKENNLNYLEVFSSNLNFCIKQIIDKIKELSK